MDELISKKTVLDALAEISREVDDGDGFDYEKWREYFCELPPAKLATDTNVGTKHGTNLAEVGTDCISRQAAIDALTEDEYREFWDCIDSSVAADIIRRLPSAQPEIIRCRNCKFASGDSRICMKFGHSPIGELDFCAWAERRTDEV